MSSLAPSLITDRFARNAIINDRFVVQEPLGEGGFSTVYKVFDSKFKIAVALKVVKDSTSAHEGLDEEFKILEQLNHPAIGRVKWGDQIHGTPIWFLILDYIEGQPLTNLIRERKPSIERSVEITRRLLEGLIYVHGQGLLHRDVKPSNIIVTSTGVKLIDFNIARGADDPSMAHTGTLPYMAPDIKFGATSWNASGDTFGLGVCLYDMLAGEYPFPGNGPSLSTPVPDPKARNPRISRELADVVMQAIQPHRSARFETAQAMLDALNAVEQLEEPPPPDDQELDLAALGIDESELSIPGHNPLLSRFLSLYSQSKDTNAGTRGLDAFTRMIYVPTRIDRELRPAIERGEFRLVIITGNAGDGKTAFIQTLEDHVARHGVTLERDESGNGTRFTFNGRRFVTNYDGSQDEGDTTNDAVLEAFFAPFQGHDWGDTDTGETRVIAINEGRLVDFLLHHRRSYPALHRQVSAFFEGQGELGPGLAIVNLNLRAVTAGEAEDPSIFDRLLERFTAPVFWDRCQGCGVADRCYVNFNVRSMRDPIYGQQVRDRLRRLFTAAHYRGQLHLTIRDLRSALAYTLFGIHTCDEIRSMLDDPQQQTAYLGYHYYNTPFADSAANTPGAADTLPLMEPSGDRLIGLLSQADVAEVANPRLDADLNTLSPASQPLFADFEGRSTYDRDLLQALCDAKPGPGDVPTRESVAAGQAFHVFARRKAYFERPDADTVEMLPFTTFPHFDTIARRNVARLDEVRDLVGRALSASEGINHTALREGHVCLRVGTERKATIKSIRRFSMEQFRIDVPSFENLARFIEYLPASFTFTAGTALRLDLNLDLFEMLSRIDRGFTPSLEELKGPFVNLLIFKRQLQALPYTELLLTPDERSFYRVRKHPDNALELTKVRLH